MNRIAAIIFVAFMPVLLLQAQENTYFSDNVYSLEFLDNVTIRSGGAEEQKPMEAWMQGGKVGGISVSPDLFEEIRQHVSEKFRIQVESKKVGSLHGVRATDITTGKISKGIYNERDGKFSFGASKATAIQGASSTDTGVIKGRFLQDMTGIEDGTLTVHFISHKGTGIVSAEAVFHFRASRDGE